MFAFINDHFSCVIVLGAIRHHILQWVSEKNRKLSDGYDFEVQATCKQIIPLLYLVEEG